MWLYVATRRHLRRSESDQTRLGWLLPAVVAHLSSCCPRGNISLLFSPLLSSWSPTWNISSCIYQCCMPLSPWPLFCTRQPTSPLFSSECLLSLLTSKKSIWLALFHRLDLNGSALGFLMASNNIGLDFCPNIFISLKFVFPSFPTQTMIRTMTWTWLMVWLPSLGATSEQTRLSWWLIVTDYGLTHNFSVPHNTRFDLAGRTCSRRSFAVSLSWQHRPPLLVWFPLLKCSDPLIS